MYLLNQLPTWLTFADVHSAMQATATVATMPAFPCIPDFTAAVHNQAGSSLQPTTTQSGNHYWIGFHFDERGLSHLVFTLHKQRQDQR